MAVCFLLHCLADCSGWVLPTALLYGARTFLGTPPKKSNATVSSTRLLLKDTVYSNATVRFW